MQPGEYAGRVGARHHARHGLDVVGVAEHGEGGLGDGELGVIHGGAYEVARSSPTQAAPWDSASASPSKAPRRPAIVAVASMGSSASASPARPASRSATVAVEGSSSQRDSSARGHVAPLLCKPDERRQRDARCRGRVGDQTEQRRGSRAAGRARVGIHRGGAHGEHRVGEQREQRAGAVDAELDERVDGETARAGVVLVGEPTQRWQRARPEGALPPRLRRCAA
ncbi:MAG: hypothetical protein FJ137_10540 [Deltaproteobacteria bacterium]|nr:hypothetical protein [Deltaproteobacteria bacterium]